MKIKYNKKQTADMINKSISWINQQISSAPSCQKFRKYGFPLPDAKVGRDIYWYESTINQWLENQTLKR